MTKYICCEYETYDHTRLGYIAFADKASAKAWRRKHASPWGVRISIFESDVCVPLHTYISRGVYFTRLERDS